MTPHIREVAARMLEKMSAEAAVFAINLIVFREEYDEDDDPYEAELESREYWTAVIEEIEKR